MSLNLTTSLSSTITKSELEGNFSSIEAKFSGGIDNSDIKNAAGISVDKLSARKEYVVIDLVANGNSGTGWAGSGYKAIAPLPGTLSTEASWKLEKASYVCTNPGSLGCHITVKFLHCKDSDGIITDFSDLIDDQPLDALGSGSAARAGQCVIASSTVALKDTFSCFFALVVGSTSDASAMNVAADILRVSLLLERDIQP